MLSLQANPVYLLVPVLLISLAMHIKWAFWVYAGHMFISLTISYSSGALRPVILNISSAYSHLVNAGGSAALAKHRSVLESWV